MVTHSLILKDFKSQMSMWIQKELRAQFCLRIKE